MALKNRAKWAADSVKMERSRITVLLNQVFKFGLVGIGATAIHSLIVIVLVQGFSWDPVVATIPAFVTAFLFSYRLNHGWTFAAIGNHRRHFFRFTIVTLSILACNLAIMYSFVDLLGLDYLLGLGVVIAVMPLVSFLLNANWAFR